MILIYFETAKRSLHDLLHEKEILIREVHHRVKNNLSILHSLLRHHLDTVDSPATAEILKKLEDKIFAFVMIHSLLHNSDSVERIDFGKYLREFSRHLVESYGESEEILSFDLRVERLEMEINYAKNLGLIVNEIITNALKHAFRPGQE
jgi:two-component sensor histidine kinase